MDDPAESALRNLYKSFLFRERKESNMKLSRIDKLRWLGGMEALLQCLGKLPSGIIFDYKITKKTFLFIPYNSKETYEQYILRNASEFITRSTNI